MIASPDAQKVSSVTLKVYLAQKTWAVYKVKGNERKYFVDTASGPMWQDIPPEVLVPPDLILDSYNDVREYLLETLPSLEDDND